MGGMLSTNRVSVDSPAAPEGTIFFKIDFPKPLGIEEETTIDVHVSYTRALQPFPAAIKQGEPQLVVYEDSRYVLTPYRSAKQDTVLKLGTQNIESHTKK